MSVRVHVTARLAWTRTPTDLIGGEVNDDPDAPREEIERLSYPRWEVEYRLKLIRELDEHQLVLMFWSAPAHNGRGTAGSEEVAEMLSVTA